MIRSQLGSILLSSSQTACPRVDAMADKADKQFYCEDKDYFMQELEDRLRQDLDRIESEAAGGPEVAADADAADAAVSYATPDKDANCVYCEYCQMWLNGPTQWEDHKIGKKHTKNVKNGKAGGIKDKDKPDEPDGIGSWIANRQSD